MTFPHEGKFTSSNFFASNDVMGKSRNGFPGPPVPEGRRVRKELKTDSTQTFLRLFNSFLTLFWLFYLPAPGTHFGTFFEFFSHSGWIAPLNGQIDPNPYQSLVRFFVNFQRPQTQENRHKSLRNCFFQKNPHVRNFPPASLRLEMAAPILWSPGIFWFFLLDNPHAHKIPRFRRGSWFFFLCSKGGGSANFIFMGVGIFPTLSFLRFVLKLGCPNSGVIVPGVIVSSELLWVSGQGGPLPCLLNAPKKKKKKLQWGASRCPFSWAAVPSGTKI